MTTNRDQIRILFKEQLTGALSESAAQQLEQLLQEDPAAREEWAALQQETTLTTVNTQRRRNATEQTTDTGTARPHRIISRQWFAWAAAVILLLIAAGSYFIYHTHQHVPGDRLISRNYVPARSAVKLLVPGSTSLALTGDSAVQIWQVGEVRLHNDAGLLRYSGLSKGYGLNTLLVPAGADYRLILSDSTEIWLNAASRLRFPFNFARNKREVYLEGEAWFKVNANAEHPFVVHTPNTTVTVLGTTLNINTYDDERVRVSLIEGTVNVKGTTDEAVTLKAGTESVYGDYNGIRTAPFDTTEVLSWMKGVAIYQDKKLRELKPLLERWFGVQIIFDKPEIAYITASGQLEKNKLTAFLHHLETTSRIRYYFSGSELHFNLP